MYIQEVIVDGFKSYSQRTVIAGWDATFNAITGLNGSGKSNILDAICFVLGISNLSQVRAASLQDLVYKQGQAGITKATVTVVFNNQDASQSPIGYEHHETISVCRQVRFLLVEMFIIIFQILTNSNSSLSIYTHFFLFRLLLEVEISILSMAIQFKRLKFKISFTRFN
jgi:predicted ATP-dependent endonuclease of OLD family